MIGFLFAGALAGLAAVAWPLYLHIRRRQQVVQEVPSLRLFQVTRRSQRRLRLQELLLLIARVVVFSALFLLIAQPVVETRAVLPLPLAAGEPSEAITIGILMDDSLAAAHGNAEGRRLDLARDWLARELAALPATVQVRLATTACPFPTPPLGRAEAIDAVNSVQLLPRPGDAMAALTALLAEVAGDHGAILVAAPRSAVLWDELEPSLERQEGVHLHWLDTSDRQADCYIRDVRPGAEPGTVICRLGGDPARLEGTALTLSINGEPYASLMVRPADVPGRAMRVELPGAPEAICQLTVQADFEHPWLSYGFTARQIDRQQHRVAILRPATRDGLIVDKLATALVTSVLPEAGLRHLRADAAPPADLPVADILVLAGQHVHERWQPWLQQCLEQGVRLVAVPLPEMTEGAMPTGVPVWGEGRRTAPAQLKPLTYRAPDRPVPGLDQLLLLGLQDMTTNEVVELSDLDPGAAVLTAASGDVLLAMEPLAGESERWTFGFTWNLGDDSAVFHPLFPLLVQAILAEQRTEVGGLGAARVGESVTLPGWFGRQRLEGQLITPDGQAIPVLCAEGRPQIVPIDQAGIYTLEQGAERLQRVANHRRPADDSLFERLTWRERFPDVPVTWLEESDTLDLADFGQIGGQNDQERRRRYDLSPLAIGLLLLAVLVEGLMLLQVWRRES